MAGKVINIHDAKIKTVQVGIKAMTINDRQVTLAVFRQLVEKELISHAGTLNGLPWGFVNYHPDKDSCGKQPHWHIVWQEGEELRRSTVSHTPAFKAFTCEEANQWCAMCLLEVATGKADGFYFKQPGSGYDGLCFEGLNIKVSLCEAAECLRLELGSIDRSIKDSFTSNSPCVHIERITINYPYQNKSWWNPIELLEALVNDLSGHGWNTAYLSCKLKLVVREEIARRKRWLDSTAAMASLPQLFVAV